MLASRDVPFVLLEGSERIGGRIRSVEFDGQTLEEGANWVQGASPTNPIYRLAIEELGLEHTTESPESGDDIQVRVGGVNATENCHVVQKREALNTAADKVSHTCILRFARLLPQATT